jgi:hypothetical protein
LESVSTDPPSSFTGSRGWRFGRLGVGNTNDILITQLGVFDSGGDGLINPHQIGLWRRDDNLSGTLLVSATVPAGTDAALIGGYRWVSIPPVAIPYANGSFFVAAQYSAGDPDNLVTPFPFDAQGGPHFAPEIGPVFEFGGRYGLGPDLPYPGSVTHGSCLECPGEMFWQPNFQYTVAPEPSVLLLVCPAALYLLLRCRRSGFTRQPNR